MIGAIVASGLQGASALWRLFGDLLKSPIGRVLLVILFSLFALTIVYRMGCAAGVSAERAAQVERLKGARGKASEMAGRSSVITKDVRQQLEAKTVDIRWRTKTLKEEVPVYVPFEVDRGVGVPVGFVRLHDAAALGAELPRTPDGPVEAPSGVALSAVAETVVDNYGACHVFEAEVLAWREWYPRQAALWSEYVKGVPAGPPPGGDR